MAAWLAGSTRLRVAQALALLSVMGFWLLPFSPFVAMGAVSLTRDRSDGWRRLAVAGALLCVVYTLLLATLIAVVAMTQI